MRYRRLTPTGDFTLGTASSNFVFDIEAVAQAIKTRIQLLRGAFWRDRSDGLPLFQSILASPGSDSNLVVIDNILKGRITGTPNVTDITFFESSFNRDTRKYLFTANVQTAYSTNIVIQDTL